MSTGVRSYGNIPWRQATEERGSGKSKRSKMLKTGGWLRTKVSTPLQRPTRKRSMQRNKKSGDRAVSHQRTWGWWLRSVGREIHSSPTKSGVNKEIGGWRWPPPVCRTLCMRREHGMEGSKAVAVSSMIEDRPKIEVLSWRVATYSPTHGTIRTSHTHAQNHASPP